MLFWWGITTVGAYIFQVRRLLTFPAYRVGDFSEVGANSRFSTKTEPLIECMPNGKPRFKKSKTRGALLNKTLFQDVFYDYMNKLTPDCGVWGVGSRPYPPPPLPSLLNLQVLLENFSPSKNCFL